MVFRTTLFWDLKYEIRDLKIMKSEIYEIRDLLKSQVECLPKCEENLFSSHFARIFRKAFLQVFPFRIWFSGDLKRWFLLSVPCHATQVGVPKPLDKSVAKNISLNIAATELQIGPL